MEALENFITQEKAQAPLQQLREVGALEQA